ncbi:transketolase [Candidatus Dojkabacteria bacterium]|nr:transketolase [Candidatus Dojkabacteria bacterium]
MNKKIKELKKKSIELKIDVIKMLDKAGSGHVGGAFGMAEIFTLLYNEIANIDPKKPDWKERDYILVSNGHICPIWYAILANIGYFDRKKLDKLRKVDSLLQGHPKINIPGVENSSGMLGHGLSQAVGVALGLKMKKMKNKVFCIMSDGEQQEGQTWEAAMSASKYFLDNLVGIIDYNKIQIDGNISDIMPLGDLKNKYEDFGWMVLDVNGHNIEHLLSCFEFVNKIKKQPTLIIAHTTPGKGVDFMENKFEYHDWTDDGEEVKEALRQLRQKLSDLY